MLNKIKKYFNKFLCAAEIHLPGPTKKIYIPAIDAETLEEFIVRVECKNCGKQIFDYHYYWNNGKPYSIENGKRIE